MFSKDLLTKYIALTEKLDESFNISSEGTIIVLEMDPQDYLLSQIIHLVEQNNANVLNVFAYLDAETSKQIVLLKVDVEDASNILRSMERFNYTVKYHEPKKSMPDEVLLNRLNELMYYLEL